MSVRIDCRRNYLHFPIKSHHFFLSNINFYDSSLKISEKYAFTSLRDLYAQFYGFIRFMLLLSVGIFYSPLADSVEWSPLLILTIFKSNYLYLYSIPYAKNDITYDMISVILRKEAVWMMKNGVYRISVSQQILAKTM